MRCATIVIAVAALGATPAAAGVRDLLADAERHWHASDFDLCLEAADALLAVADAPRTDRVEALRLKGSALVVLRRESEAAAAFEALFELDPDYELPEGSSPRIRLDVFEPTRARWQIKVEERLAGSWAALAMDVHLPRRAKGGLPLNITIRLTDPARITDSLVLAYRRRGERHYATVTAPGAPGAVTIAIPGAVLAARRAFELELFVRARHRSGSTLRWQGGPEHPLVLPVAAGQVPSSNKPWWIAGGAAIVLGAVIVVAVRSHDVGPQTLIGRP